MFKKIFRLVCGDRAATKRTGQDTFCNHAQNLFCYKKKSNLHYPLVITPKRITSDGANLRGSSPGQHSSEETSQRWQAVGNTEPDLTDPVIELEPSRNDSVAFNHYSISDRLFSEDLNSLNIAFATMKLGLVLGVKNRYMPTRSELCGQVSYYSAPAG